MIRAELARQMLGNWREMRTGKVGGYRASIRYPLTPAVLPIDLSDLPRTMRYGKQTVSRHRQAKGDTDA
jgi:hypothetical protein